MLAFLEAEEPLRNDLRLKNCGKNNNQHALEFICSAHVQILSEQRTVVGISVGSVGWNNFNLFIFILDYMLCGSLLIYNLFPRRS